jgi:hypothetical protein
MIQSITFGDKNTWDDWRLLPVSRPVFAPPKVKTNYIDIPGGNGTLDLSESLTKYPVYDNRTGSFKFRVMNDYVSWADRYSEIMGYLHGRTMRAILADDPDYFYQGRFSVDSWDSGDTWSEITIGYNVNPFKWSVLSSTEPWIWDSFNFDTGIIREQTFSSISINSPSSWITHTFMSDFFGDVPISPTITISDAPSTGMDIQFINTYLNIDETLNFKNGTTPAPDFIFYGQTNEYIMRFKGTGVISIDFRVGRL